MKAVIAYFISCLTAAIALTGVGYLISLMMNHGIFAEATRALVILGDLGIMALFLMFCAMKAWQNVRSDSGKEGH